MHYRILIGSKEKLKKYIYIFLGVKRIYMKASSLVSFTFLSTKTLCSCLKYLCAQGNTIKFLCSKRVGLSEARLSSTCVSDCSFSEIIIDVLVEESMLSEMEVSSIADAENSFSWVVDGPLFLRILRLFEGCDSLTVELGSDLTSVFLYSKMCERWARMGVLHDLGPHINIEHAVSTLHRISDIYAFCHIVRFVASTQDAVCTVTLRFDNLQAYIELKTLHAMASALVDGELLQSRIGGCVKTVELFEFAELALQVKTGATLYVGFGAGDLAMLKLAWKPTLLERSTAILYFCGDL